MGLWQLAKLLGKLMAASQALQPVQLWSRECYALIRARTKAEWDAAVQLSDGAREELLFWAQHLLRWNAVGRKMFPETQPIEIEITGDAGPQGWGARIVDGGAARSSYDQRRRWGWWPQEPSYGVAADDAGGRRDDGRG